MTGLGIAGLASNLSALNFSGEIAAAELFILPIGDAAAAAIAEALASRYLIQATDVNE
jgi:hypothetical protein